MRPLRIAFVAPLVSPIASPFLGGAQVLLHDLAIGLAARGHQVSVYAAPGSHLPGCEIVELTHGPEAEIDLSKIRVDLHSSQNANLHPTFFAQGELFLRAFLDIAQRNEFDLVHAHAYDWPCFLAGASCPVPVIHTLHLPAIDPSIAALIGQIRRFRTQNRFVTVSRACAQTWADSFSFDEILYNGIDLSPIAFGPEGDDSLLFVGRISPEKGVEEAIDIALESGRKLVLIGGIYSPSYHAARLAPLLAEHPEQLEYLGALPRCEVFKHMAKASALLFTSRIEEAFGLALVEAQAAGLPVVAFDRGAAKEVVADGQTGFVVPPHVEEACVALGHIDSIDRSRCRQHIESRFSLSRMLDEHERYYDVVLGEVAGEDRNG
jgi:glycosyltransferase involved in cell wall biosynthesis